MQAVFGDGLSLKLSLLHHVCMHSLCIFDHCFPSHSKPVLCAKKNHPLHMDAFYLPMNGNKSKISKNLELSRLPKTKILVFSCAHILQISISFIFFTPNDPAWSHPYYINLNFPMIFRKAHMALSFFFFVEIILVKCHLRVKMMKFLWDKRACSYC